MSATTPMRLTETRPRVQEMSTTRRPAADVVVSRGFDWSILSRIVAPMVAGLAVLTLVSRSSSVQGLLIFVAAWVVLDVAALTVGHDSRDGLDWRRGHTELLSNRW